MNPTGKVLEEDTSFLTEFTIHVDCDLKRNVYAVECADSGLTAEAPSLCEALHQLANQYDANELYGSHLFNATETEMGRRTKACKYCPGKIFFAQDENSLKWLAMDAESVSTTLKGPGISGFVLMNMNAGFKAPLAHYARAQFHGQVWISHYHVCGSNPKCPESPYLQKRWEVNRGATVEAHNAAAADLQRMRDNLVKRAS